MRALPLVLLVALLAGCSFNVETSRQEPSSPEGFSVAKLEWSGQVPQGYAVEPGRVSDPCGGAAERSMEGRVDSWTPPAGSSGHVDLTASRAAVLRLCIARADDGSLLFVDERAAPIRVELEDLTGAELRLHVYPGDDLRQPVGVTLHAYASRSEPQPR